MVKISTGPKLLLTEKGSMLRQKSCF